MTVVRPADRGFLTPDTLDNRAVYRLEAHNCFILRYVLMPTIESYILFVLSGPTQDKAVYRPKAHSCFSSCATT